MDFIGWETIYAEEREVGGTMLRQTVTEFVISTAHGLAHFKLCTNHRNGKTRVFTDLDATFKVTSKASSEMERVKRHKQFWLMHKTAAKNQSVTTYIPFGDTEEILENRPALKTALHADEKALNAWKTIMGESDAPKLDDILAQAEAITAGQRHVAQQERVKELAVADNTWGMF